MHFFFIFQKSLIDYKTIQIFYIFLILFRHNGIKKRIGYDPGILFAHCFNRWLPTYFKMLPGNRNDIIAFKKTVDEFLKTSPYQWQDVIVDTGPYSLQNLNYIQLKGMVPVIRSKKNLKTHPIRELKKGYFFIPILFQNGGQTITFLISIVFDA